MRKYVEGDCGVYVDSAPLMQANYQENVHPIPFGAHSILSELTNKKIKAAEAMLYLILNYLSSWSSHTTHCLTAIQLAKLMGVSESYINTLKYRLDSYISSVKRKRHGCIYKIKAFINEKTDKKTFAVPYGEKSPFQFMFDGTITWKACLIWIMYKRFSNWNTGITEPITIHRMAKLCGFSPNTVIDAIKQLQKAGLLVRISKMVYQLFPMPKPKAKKQRKSKKHDDYSETKNHFYSKNWQFRLSKGHGYAEKRIGYRSWRKIEWHLIPNPIRVLFDVLLGVFSLKNALLC